MPSRLTAYSGDQHCTSRVRELEAELAEALAHQAATSDVLRAISRSPAALQPVFDTIVVSAARLCGAVLGNVQLYDGRQLQVVATHNYGAAALEQFSQHYPMKPNRSQLSGRAILARELVHVSDVLSDPEYLHDFAAAGGLRAMLSVPMLREGKPVGVITVAKQEPVPFTERQMRLLQTFADQAVIAIENARLFEEAQARTREVQQALEQQTATSKVLSTISASPGELGPVFDTLLASARELCEAEFGHLLLFNGETWGAAALHNLPQPYADFWTSAPVLAPPESLLGRILQTRRWHQVVDATQGAAYKARHPLGVATVELGGARTLFGVPLLKDGGVVGAIVLYRKEVRPFNDHQIALLSSFADQALIAIENARLFEAEQARTRELKESLEYQTAVTEVLGVISKSPNDLRPVFTTIAHTARLLCEAERASVHRPDEQGNYWVVASDGPMPYDSDGSALSAPAPLGRASVVGRVAAAQRVVQVPDIQSDPDFNYLRDRVTNDRRRTALGVPLLHKGKVVGTITLLRTEVREFTERQIALVATFADQAVIAIENARLFEEVQARTKELQQSLEYQTATGEVLNVISRSPTELQPVLDAIVATAAGLCRAEFAIIFKHHGGKYHIAAANNAEAEFIKHASEHPIPPDRGSLIGRTALERKPVHLPDCLSDPEFTFLEYQRIGKYRSMLGVPLLREGVPIGVIGLMRTTVAPFTDKQIDLVMTFADQAVIAIENTRLFEEVQAKTRELGRSLDELRALSEVGQAISSTLDLTAVLDAILMHACRLADSGGGAIYVFDEARGAFDLEAAYNMSPEFIAAVRAHPIQLGDTLIGECAARRAAVQIEDLSQAPPHPLFAEYMGTGIKALLAVPLLHQHKVIGALVVRRKRVGAFSADIVGLLQSFAAQSAIAIQNARLFREIEDKSYQLELASQHKSQFLANMSHELRTPLNAVLGYAELMQDGVYGELSDKVKAVLERVQSNGKHLLGLINDVLDLAKIEAGQLTLRIEEYSMKQVVETVVTATESLAAEKRLPLAVSVPPSLPVGRGDERRIAQVLLNLVGNAIKFTDDGEIRISARADGNRFRVCVADTGPGIPLSEQGRIFEEFHQIDSSNTKKKGGTGLGLAIARRIVALHGGRLWVESEPGKGSSFYVDLPVTATPELGAS